MSQSLPLRRTRPFELETELGTRLLEFDPDILRGRDVRILVDGRPIAALPYPKPAAPYAQTAFAVDGHELVGATWLLPESDNEFPLGFDLFSDGHSLTDGASLTEIRASTSTPRAPYPTSFVIIDNVIRVAPAAAAPAFVFGIARGAGEVAWPTLIAVFAAMVAALLGGSLIASRLWQEIKAAERWSATSRAVLGCGGILGSYALAVLIILVVGLTLRR